MNLRILTIAVRTELDVVASRQRARQVASLCGFGAQDQARISTAVSEMTRNIVNYAVEGRVEFCVDAASAPQVLVVRIEDKGPGIDHLESILAGRYDSTTGLGLGILGARRLMDHCEINTGNAQGTSIVLKKALPRGAPLLTPASVGSFGAQLATMSNIAALSEARQQNKDLIDALDALKETNRSMLALNAELDEKAVQLQSTDRRKDEFLAILSHELRNPLAATSMAASLLGVPPVTEARAAQLSQVIMRQVGHMNRLVEDLLDVSRVSRGLVILDKAPVDMRTAIQSAVEQVGPFIKAKAHTLAVSLPEHICCVSGDSTRLIQVVSNLLSNAARYTPEGGHISVTLATDESNAMLRVTDNGVGIDPDLMPQLFDLYVQAERSSDRKNGGLGLGLALVKSIIELHGGGVTATSDGANLGSTFEVHLPRLSEVDSPCEPGADGESRSKTGSQVH
jgi:signal transduction histidine kinase